MCGSWPALSRYSNGQQHKVHSGSRAPTHRSPHRRLRIRQLRSGSNARRGTRRKMTRRHRSGARRNPVGNRGKSTCWPWHSGRQDKRCSLWRRAECLYRCCGRLCCTPGMQVGPRSQRTALRCTSCKRSGQLIPCNVPQGTRYRQQHCLCQKAFPRGMPCNCDPSCGWGSCFRSVQACIAKASCTRGCWLVSVPCFHTLMTNSPATCYILHRWSTCMPPA